jgi:sugar phosphate isomerase/epimerase
MLDLDRLAVNEMTTRGSTFEEDVAAYGRNGIARIGVLREKLDAAGAVRAARLLRNVGISPTSLSISGFFADRRARVHEERIDDARRAIADAATIGAPVLVVVTGPAVSPRRRDAWAQTEEALARLAPEANAAGVRLAVEPLHPMYAAEASFICTSADALALVDSLPVHDVGVVLDTYHLWWEGDFPHALLSRPERVALVHLSDWRKPTRSLCDRELPGRGSIDWEGFFASLEASGYAGSLELEILSDELWQRPPEQLLQDSVGALADLLRATGRAA